jgi:hypothetical protein
MGFVRPDTAGFDGSSIELGDGGRQRRGLKRPGLEQPEEQWGELRQQIWCELIRL